MATRWANLGKEKIRGKRRRRRRREG